MLVFSEPCTDTIAGVLEGAGHSVDLTYRMPFTDATPPTLTSWNGADTPFNFNSPTHTKLFFARTDDSSDLAVMVADLVEKARQQGLFHLTFVDVLNACNAGDLDNTERLYSLCAGLPVMIPSYQVGKKPKVTGATMTHLTRYCTH